MLTLRLSALPRLTTLNDIVTQAPQRITKEKDIYKEHLGRAKNLHRQYASDTSSSNPRHRSNDSTNTLDFETLELVGGGSTGEVHKVLLNGGLMACKRMRIEGGISPLVGLWNKSRRKYLSCGH